MSLKPPKKKLLIIKSSPSSLNSVESFLRNRDWNIMSTTSLKEALIFVVKEKPQFVMVDINHPNRKIQNLPKILTQALHICVIAFTEDIPNAYGLLNNCRTEYRLYPPVTGPAVERTVSKFFKDQQAKNQKTALSGIAINDRNDDGVIAIKGSSSNVSTQSLLQRLMSIDEPSFLQGTDSSSHQQGATANQSATGELWAPLNDSSANLGNSKTDPGKKGGSHNLFSTKSSTAPTGWVPQDIGADATYASEVSRRPSSPRTTPKELEANPLASKMDSIILRGTQSALQKSCTKTDFFESEALEDSSNISCLILESTRISGYLIAAMGKNRCIDGAFIKKIQKHLCTFLEENGEVINDNDLLNLRIQTVPFEKWSLDQAEFLRKSVHEGHEMAMAFFPRTDLKSRHKVSAAEEMISIKLEELAGNVAVEFNVYIYLPQNEKYILYTPRGATFHSIQKERLQNQGVTSLHILRMELPDLDIYRAQNFLNEKVAHFESSQKENSLPKIA